MVEYTSYQNDDGFTTPYYQRPIQEAWVKYILEFPMPSIKTDVKYEIIKILEPVMNTASKSNILRREIPIHLDAYDIIWDKYLSYMRKGKYDPAILTLREGLREGFDLQLNRSVEAGQMRLLLQHQQSIIQRFISGAERRLGLFKTKQQHEHPQMNTM